MVNDARSMIENGCNWTAALGLLCFSEACGKLYATKVLREKLGPGGNFKKFLEDCMECSDTEALEGELYGDVRSGPAHNFFLLREEHRLQVMIGVDEKALNLSLLALRDYDFIEDTEAGRSGGSRACRTSGGFSTDSIGWSLERVDDGDPNIRGNEPRTRDSGIPACSTTGPE
ncbi:MAG: hypothetical protein HY717_18830 [Planctomycetes bacterium]|nr:hypothetical protein [Planctomycetota bacterium]